MNQENKERIQKKKGSQAALWIWRVLILFVLAGLGLLGWWSVKRWSSPADQFAKALSRLSNTEVEMEGQSVVLKTEEVAELALMEQTSSSIIKYTSRWLGSDNMLILRGSFKVKTGYDLSEFSSLEFLSGSSLPSKLPSAKILSLEMTDYEVYHSENGVLNKLTPKDQEKALKQLLEQAREDAKKGDLFSQTERLFRQRMSDLLL